MTAAKDTAAEINTPEFSVENVSIPIGCSFIESSCFRSNANCAFSISSGVMVVTNYYMMATTIVVSETSVMILCSCEILHRSTGPNTPQV